ncbi:MAG TPA: hypothetical protein VHX39_32585, partial [Acetobacteraceae bacterium]|nr:hypothetical protein [Acetobacteraceae bacterium]
MPVDPPASPDESPSLYWAGLRDDATTLGGVAGAFRRLGLICALLIVTTLAIGLGVIWQLRSSAIADTQRELSNLGTVLAEQTSRTVQSIDLVLQEVQAHVATFHPTSPEGFRTEFAGEPTREYLSGLLRNLPQAETINLVDAKGTLLNWSRDRPLKQLDDSMRDYFIWLRDHDDNGAFIGLPVWGRVNGKRVLFVARRIDGPDGTFLGIAVGLIDTKYLEGFYGTISMVPGESVSVLRRDGFLIARYPEIAKPANPQMPAESPWFDRIANGGGSYLTPGYFSGTPSIITVHPLRDYGLVVDVNMYQKAALRVWHTQAIVIALVMAGVTAAIAVLFAVIIGQFRRQEEQNARLSLGRTALRDSERRLKAYAQMAADWFWEQDAELRFVRDSAIPHITRRDDVGKSRWDLADREMDPGRWDAHKAVLAARLPFR